jgi:tRNA modification GTPase
VEAGDDHALIQQSLEAIRKQLEGKGKDLVVVLNKADQVDLKTHGNLEKSFELAENEHLISISANTAYQVDKLSGLLLQIVSRGSLRHQDVVISNVRHLNALKSASESLSRVSEGLTSALPTDLLAQDIREALHFLGEITGEVTTDEILGNIFKNFCIGK